MFQVALFEPEIPGNTGNIIRLCANTGSALHLVGPLGFELDDRRLRRAGLDYHEWAKVARHRDYETWREETAPPRVVAFSTRGTGSLASVRFEVGDALLFGPETRGLPPAILETLPPERIVRIPMRPPARSLNLSNAVSIAVYEAWRQHRYDGAE